MDPDIRIKIEQLPEGLYLATSEDLPGLVAQGRSADETLAIARDVARKNCYEPGGNGKPCLR
ncbi:MAG: hypothetical protein KJZ84_19490 [Bryobacteraceae bacterium]|nr:hypothetical protein [Bryobacteraceae bacterium]